MGPGNWNLRNWQSFAQAPRIKLLYPHETLKNSGKTEKCDMPAIPIQIVDDLIWNQVVEIINNTDVITQAIERERCKQNEGSGSEKELETVRQQLEQTD